MRIIFSTALLVATRVGASPARASAQTSQGVGLSIGLIGEVFGTVAPSPHVRNSMGIVTQVDLRQSHHIALETRLVIFPRAEFPVFKDQGGRTMEGAVGLRLDTGDRRLQLSAATLVGFRHLTDTYSDGSIGAQPGPWTMLVFISSVAATARLGSSSFARAGCELFVSPENGQQIPIGGRLSEIIPAVINDGVRCHAAFGHGFGHTLQVPDHAPEPRSLASRRLTVGFGAARSEYATSFDDASIQRKNGALGFASYTVRRWCDVEAVTQVFRPTNVPTPYEGGVLAEGLAWVRSGVRQRRFGAFIVFCAGVDSWSEVNTAVAGTPTQAATRVFSYKRLNDPTLEFGAALEAVLTSRALLRAELLDHMAFDGPAVTFGTPFVLPAMTNHSLGISLGLGFSL